MTTQESTQDQQDAQESDAAFASGFGEVRGIEPPAKTELAVVKEPETKAEGEGVATSDPQKPAAESKPDPQDEWAGVPPKVKAELESMRALVSGVAKVPDRLRTIEGHIGGLTSFTRDLKAALETSRTAAEAKGAEAPSKALVEFAAKSPEQWKQLKEDYPDWADVMEAELAAVRSEIAASKTPAGLDEKALDAALKSRLAEMRDEIRKESKAEVVKEARVLARIDLAHDGWEETINTPEFEAWYGAQPKEVQALSASGSAKEAIRMLDLYAAHRKTDSDRTAKEVEKQRRLERTIGPTGVTVTAVAEDPERAFEAGFKSVRGT